MRNPRRIKILAVYDLRGVPSQMLLSLNSHMFYTFDFAVRNLAFAGYTLYVYIRLTINNFIPLNSTAQLSTIYFYTFYMMIYYISL